MGDILRPKREKAMEERRFDLSGEENRANREKAADILRRAEEQIIGELTTDALYKLTGEEGLSIKTLKELRNPEGGLYLQIGFLKPGEENFEEGSTDCFVWVAKKREPTTDATIDIWVEWHGSLVPGKGVPEQLQKAVIDILEGSIRESKENRGRK